MTTEEKQTLKDEKAAKLIDEGVPTQFIAELCKLPYDHVSKSDTIMEALRINGIEHKQFKKVRGAFKQVKEEEATFSNSKVLELLETRMMSDVRLRRFMLFMAFTGIVEQHTKPRGPDISDILGKFFGKPD